MLMPKLARGSANRGGINFHGIAERTSRRVTAALGTRGFAPALSGTASALLPREVDMTRAVLSAAIDSDWRLVSTERPCPVCGSRDACSVHTKDDFACCAREPSQWKLTTGAWLHRLEVPSRVALVSDAVDQIDPSQSGIRIRL